MIRHSLVLMMVLVSNAALAVQPNVVLILVDDLGWRDSSGAGNSICSTPNIDQLAKDGMRFHQAYAACAVCSPTRAAIQTGRYPARVGVTDWIRSQFQRPGGATPPENPTEFVGGKNRKLLCPPNPFWMETSEVTLAETLAGAGYRTAYIGKWHLGDDAWFPEHQGFEENFGGCDYGQPPSYFDPFNQPNGRHQTLRSGIFKLPSRKPGEYLTDREVDEACGLIRRWKTQPFFIQLSHYAVHTPLQAPQSEVAKYQRDGVTKQQAIYAAMVESVDRAVQKIRTCLRENRLEENTLIWFTSDNGGLDQKGNPTENFPLREGKGHPYEGGIRVPNIVQWKEKIPAGATTDYPISSIDVMPTVADLCATPLPNELTIDGVSLAADLLSGGRNPPAERPLIWHFPHYRGNISPYSIIRRGPWKLLHYYEGIEELYNLSDDPGESENLAAKHPERVVSLRTELDGMLNEMGAKIPRENPLAQSP